MATQTITPSTTFVTIDSLQSPFTTVVLSTIGFKGQTVTVLDRTASASVKNPILISSVTGTSTIIDQASGFVTLQTNGSSWSYLNTFPFWNQEISSGVSVLTTSTLYTNINSTIVETLDTMDVENIVITGLFPRSEAATFIRSLTVTGHAEFLSSFRANAAFTISSYLSTFSSLHLASSLTVGGPITIQSTLTALSSFFVSSVVTATSLSTGLLTVAGNLFLSSIDLQQSTGITLNIGGNLEVKKGLTVLSSVTTGNSVTAASLFVGSSLSTVTMAVGSNLYVSTNISTGNLFQNDSFTVTGLTHFYGTTTVASSVNAYSATMKNFLYLDNALNASTASIQNLRVIGTVSNVGQTSVSSNVSTLQNLNTGTFVASSTQLAVQGSFSTIGSLYDMANLTTVSSIQVKGSVSSPSTLTVGGNSLFRGPVQVNGNIAFTSSLTLLSSLNVLNTLSINTFLTRFSTTIIGNLNAASTVNVSGIAWLSSYSLPSAATVNQINVVSSLIVQGVLSTAITASPLIPLYTSSLGVGYASTSYTVQLPYIISSQSALVSSLSTLQLAPYGSTRISTSMAIGMSSLGPGLDVGDLAKVNETIYSFQTISSQKTYASTVAGYFYGDARGLSNFGLSTTIITSRLLISSLSTLNTSTGLFMGSSGSMVASLTLTSTLFFQSNPFINTTYGGNPQASTNQLLVYPYTQLQLNNSVYVIPGSNAPGKVGVNTSAPNYTLHVEKSLAIGGIGGASIEFRSVQYDTLIMSTITDGTNAYINSGVLEMSNLLIDSTNNNNTYYVTTFAGSGTASFADGQGIAASFYQPIGIAIDPLSNLYVSDTYNQRIRKITPSGLVTTIAGNGTAGYFNSLGKGASFDLPMGLTLDSSSNIYVCDYNNSVIRKITPAGVVTTFAGSGTPTFLDGNGTSASFNLPTGIVLDSTGNLYVADNANNRIRKIDTSANVTTIAGNGSAIYTDGFGISASFNNPFSIAIDKNNNLYIGDRYNYRIRKIDPSHNVTTIAGDGTNGYLDGNGTAATVGWVEGLCVDSTNTIFFTEFFSKIIRKISPSGTVSTISGQPNVNGNTNGMGLSALFNIPANIVADSTGILYLCDYYNNTIRKIIPKYDTHSNTNRIQTVQSTLNVNNLMYIGQSTVGIGVSSPNYTLDAYSLGTASNFTTYTTEVNATIQVNPTEKSVWVATSATDEIQSSNFTYSLDHGTTWSDGNDQQLWNLTKGAAYNGSYWVSPGNPIMTSTDGSIWNSVVAQGGSGSFLTGGGKVAWNGSYWVASGPSSNRQGTLLKSQDGVNWTPSATGGFTTGSVFQGSDILWTGTQWVATGLGANDVSSIQLSQDGVNWSSARSGGFTTGGNGLSFGPRIPYEKGFEQYQGNQLLFAVGNDSLLNSIQYSYDGGFNWSTITSGGFYTKGNAIDTDGKYLIAVGKDTFSQSNIQIGTIQTNPFKVIFTDYNSYTGNTIYPFDNNGNCVKWNGSEWLLGGDNGLRKLIPTSNSYFSSITVQGTINIGRILATDQNSITSLPTYSIDNGVTYKKSPPVYGGFRNGLLKSNGSNLWVTIGNTHPAAWYSRDGLQWTQITNIPFNRNGQNPYFLTFTNNRWFLTSYDTTNNYSTLCTSVDGINWSNIPTLDSRVVFNIIYGVGTAGGIYVAANNSALNYSYDLVTWNNVQGQTGTDGVWYNGKIVFGQGVFIVSGNSEPFGNLGNQYQVNAGRVDGSDNQGRYDYLAKNGRPYIRSTDGINWSYLYFTPNFNWDPYSYGCNVWGPQVLSYSSKLGQFLTGGILRSSLCPSWNNGIYLFYSYDGTTWTPCMRVKSDPAIGLIYPWDAFYLIDKWILSAWNLGEAGYTAATAFYPFWYSTDGITFSNYSIFPSPVETGYNLSGFAQNVPVLSNETYGVAYTSNLISLANTSSFSVFADTDINTIHSQTTNNTMHVTSNTIVLNDLFTVTDKVVNFGSYPLDYTIAKQSSLSIFQNIEITSYLSTGSATISSLYLGIQSV